MTQSIRPNHDARQGILDRIRTKAVQIPELPEVDESRVIQFDDPLQTFIEMLQFVGGQAHLVGSHDEIRMRLEEIEVFRTASQIYSNVTATIVGNVDADQIDDPHELSTLDWTIAEGDFMVAENGAIWIDGDTLPHRVLLFIAQYLAIVVRKSQIVSNMHQAYRRIEGYPGRFGVFVSGPSKTADIEQSLVLGAHGCRKLQVFVIQDDDSSESILHQRSIAM